MTSCNSLPNRRDIWFNCRSYSSGILLQEVSSILQEVSSILQDVSSILQVVSSVLQEELSCDS